MLKTCQECKRLFEGNGQLCSKCKTSTNNNKTLGTCKSCSIVTVNRIEDYCFTCAFDQVDHFKIAKTYLYLNPRVTVKALSEATGISVLEINRYVKEGRLDISDEVSQVNKEKICLDCGQVIDYGNLCLFCKKNREELKQSKNMNENQNQKNKNKFFTKRDN